MRTGCDLKTIHADAWVVDFNFVEPWIHHVLYAVHRQTRLSDIRTHNTFPVIFFFFNKFYNKNVRDK